MISAQNAELFLDDLRGKLTDQHGNCVKLSACGASAIYDLAGIEDHVVISSDEEAEFFVPKDDLKALVEAAERQIPLLRRAQFRII